MYKSVRVIRQGLFPQGVMDPKFKSSISRCSRPKSQLQWCTVFGFIANFVHDGGCIL